MEPETLDALIEEARKGSREAFARLLCLHQARVRSYLDRLLAHKDLDLVDDLAQQTFLDAFHALPAFAGDSPFEFWLLRLAKHRALKFLRDDGRRRDREQRAVEGVLSRLAADRFEREEDDHARRVDALRACLRGLPPRSADLVADHYFRACPGAEIARRHEMKEGTLWVTLLRIREALRGCVEKRLGAEGGRA
jgi:RNA polymerase sigma-70 factor (ECF subfamily)